MDSMNVVMFSAPYLVVVASLVVAITTFGLGDDVLDGLLACASNSLGYG
jgi:hypothetical protein